MNNSIWLNETAKANRKLLGSQGSGCYSVHQGVTHKGYVRRVKTGSVVEWLLMDPQMHMIHEAGRARLYPTRKDAVEALLKETS